jgi:hypothetical protein
MGATSRRESQIERGELGCHRRRRPLVERFDLIAGFGDHTLTVATTEAA